MTEQVLVEMKLTFVRESVYVVVPANSPTESLQPVAVSDVLSGARMDVQPLAGDDFQSLLTVLPGHHSWSGWAASREGRRADDRGAAGQQRHNDPSTGDFNLELPSGAVESVEVLSNPFAAEYGHFSTSVTQVRTRRGTNDWIVRPGNLDARLRQGVRLHQPVRATPLDFGPNQTRPAALRPVPAISFRPHGGEEPARRAATGPRQLRLVYPRRCRSFAAPRADGRHHLLPAQITNATMSTFRPPETTPTFTQEGFSAGLVDRLILSPGAVLESTLAVPDVQSRIEERRTTCPWSTLQRGRAAPFSTDRNGRWAACRSSKPWRSQRTRRNGPARLQNRLRFAALEDSTARLQPRESTSFGSTARWPSGSTYAPLRR